MDMARRLGFVSPLAPNLTLTLGASDVTLAEMTRAYAALAAIYAWSRYRLVAIALIAWTVCVWLAIVYLGEHYFVDALAGLVYALAAVGAVETVARRRHSGPKAPTPATPSS